MMDKKTLQQLSQQVHKMLRILEVRAKGRGLEGLGDTLEVLNKDLAAAMTDAFGGTYDWGKDLQELKEFEAPPKPGVHSYSVSGVECNLYVIRQGEVIPIPSAQGVSWVAGRDPSIGRRMVSGSILCVLLGPSPFEACMTFDRIIVQSEITRGRFMNLVIEDVEIVGYGSGVSIQDIIVEETYTFQADSLRPWKLGRLVDQEGEDYILLPEE